MRKALAILTLLVFYASLAEVGVGLARDGAVHHESVATAAQHSAESQGEHGHEAGAEASDTEHGPEHEHGTGSDHCTHTHGSALVPSGHFPITLVQAPIPTPEPPSPSTDLATTPLWHPPRS